MEDHKFPPPPIGPIERQECIKGDPIEPPDELNQAFIGDDYDDRKEMSPIEDSIRTLQIAPSTPDKRPKCICPGAPRRPSLVTLEMLVDYDYDYPRSESRSASPPKSPGYQMWAKDDE